MSVYSRLKKVGSIGLMCIVVLFSFSPSASAELGTVQLAQLQALLQQVAQLQAQLLQLQGGTQTAVNSCTQITHLLTMGSTDATTNGDVSKLQKYLAYDDYYNYGIVTGYFGQVTLDAVRKWQDTENFYEEYGTPAGRGVVGERSRAKIAESCNFVTINQHSVVSSNNSFTLSGTAKNAQAVFVALVSPYTSGPTDWHTTYTTGAFSAFTGDTVNKVVDGKWSVKFSGIRSGNYEARVYENNNSTQQNLLYTQPLRVTAPETINFSIGSSPKTITLGEQQKATDGGITITASDVFLTNGLTGSPRASFIIQVAGLSAASYSAGLGENVPVDGGGFSDLKAPNNTIKFKVTDISQSMNTVTLSVEDPGPKG